MLNLNDNLALFQPTPSNKVESHRPLQVNRNGVQPQRLTLLEIGERAKHRKTLRFLPTDVVLKIQKLKIQRKRRRGRGGGHEQRRRKMMMEYKLVRKVDHANLIHVQIDRDRHVKTRQVNLVLGLANVRSVKNKDVWIKQILVEEDIDLCVLTETWLNSNDIPWIDGSDLNNDGYTMDNSLRNNGKRGRGLAIIYKDSLEIKKIEEKHANTYQSAK